MTGILELGVRDACSAAEALGKSISPAPAASAPRPMARALRLRPQPPSCVLRLAGPTRLYPPTDLRVPLCPVRLAPRTHRHAGLILRHVAPIPSAVLSLCRGYRLG